MLEGHLDYAIPSRCCLRVDKWGWIGGVNYALFGSSGSSIIAGEGYLKPKIRHQNTTLITESGGMPSYKAPESYADPSS